MNDRWRQRILVRAQSFAEDVAERRRIADAHRGVRVSVIVPVYNAVRFLPDLLASLDDQGLSRRRLEVIIVDDGSTDGSSELLDAHQLQHPSDTVVHQPNSGWPGQPRNRALELATGRWVFFADADDVLAPDALRELADFGDQVDSQLVLPRVKRFGTRKGGRPFSETLASITKRQAFRTFTPHKLVRRELIESAGIRFPEGQVRLEDGIFFTRCYLLADRISTLADRDLYFLRGRDDGGNISAQPADPSAYVASLDRIADQIYELSQGARMTRALVGELIRRKCFSVYRPERFPRYNRGRQQAWLAAHADFFRRHVTDDVLSALSKTNQRRCALIMAGDRDGLLADIADRVPAAAVAVG